MADNSASLIFRIRADGSNAEAELRKVEREIKKIAGSGDINQLQKGFKGAASEASNLVSIFTGNKLTGITSQISSFGGAVGAIPGPAGLAVGAVAGLTAAFASAGAGLFAITKASAEYGSEIHDLRDKLGLTAETVTTLKVAADNAGASIETVAGGTEKFAKLIGQAADGNEKAQKTLKDLGVTSYDLDTALSQVSETIFHAKDGTEQITIAQKAFGRSGAELIPVIKQFGGDLEAATKEAERLGITLSDKAVDASDAFGDSLGVLSAQAKAAGVAFSSELMPMFTAYATTASEWYARNKGEVQQWGIATRETIQGVAYIVEGMVAPYNAAFNAIGQILGENEARWLKWRAVIATVIPAPLLLLQQIGQLTAPLGAQIGGTVGAQVGAPSFRIPSGGGGKGGGGGGKSSDDDKEFREAQKRVRQMVEDYKAGFQRMTAENDLRLKKGEISEIDHAQFLAEITEKRIQYEIEQTEILLKVEHATADEKAEIEHKLGILRTELSTQRVKDEKDTLTAIQKAFEDFEKSIDDSDAAYQEARKKRREREKKEATDRANASAPTDSQRENLRRLNDANLSILGDSVLSVRNELGTIQPDSMIKPTFVAMQMLGSAVNDLASGFGNLVQQMVLTGSAGPHAMRKLVASVLAGVAAQAATLAIMETAYGIAALTPWGAGVYGPAAPHFKAAALFAAVAVGTGLAGRAVAGNSFNSAGSSGGAVAAGANSSSSDPNARGNSFTTPFNGFSNGGRSLNDTLQRLVIVTAQAEETHAKLANRIDSLPPGVIVANGAASAAPHITDAVVGQLQTDQGATGAMLRNMGLVR